MKHSLFLAIQKLKQHAPLVILAVVALLLFGARKSTSPTPATFEMAITSDSAEHRSFGAGLGSQLKASQNESTAESAADAAASGSAAASPLMAQAHAAEPVAQNAMLIRNGSINAYVDSLKDSKKTVHEKIKKYKARVDAENQSNEYSALTLSMTIKVPADQFQQLYDELLEISSKVTNNSINVDDITKQYVDTKSRLENKKILQDRLRELAKRAGKVADVLQVEQELARVSEDIDATTKVLKQFENDVAWSSVYLTLSEPKANAGPVATPISFIKKIGMAFKSGFDWILDSILELISWWPALLLILGAWIYLRRSGLLKK